MEKLNFVADSAHAAFEQLAANQQPCPSDLRDMSILDSEELRSCEPEEAGLQQL